MPTPEVVEVEPDIVEEEADDEPIVIKVPLEDSEIVLVLSVLLRVTVVGPPLLPPLPPLPPLFALLIEDRELVDDVEPPVFPLLIDEELMNDNEVELVYAEE